jgi:asparagine synthase (glutamine-hydrolysing)
MCGIVTIMTSAGKGVSSVTLQTMTAKLDHRGPDGGGYAWVDPASGTCRVWDAAFPGHEELAGVLFGHRRLSILDLSTAGHQPMVNDDQSLILTYNGEIYNFLELREELEAHHMTFRSQSDTEVLLKAYEQWSVEAFTKLNGMWALTLWDGRRRTLVASRDRFGVKPLYYTVVDGTWIFASEIKAILAYPGAFRGIDEHKVMEFLARGLINHTQQTLFRDIHAVEPGSYMELTGHTVKHRQFWVLHANTAHEAQPDSLLVKQFRELLADAVRLRVRSDVPIGTMLSGGLDSTSITALIHKHRLAHLAGSGPASEGLHSFHHTFSACWPGSVLDEERAVDLMCKELNLLSHKLYLTDAITADFLPKVVCCLDEPFESPTAVVQYLLMREARAYGVKVVLNGHGSDEMLGGYPDFFIPPFLAGLLLAARPMLALREYRAFQTSYELGRRQMLVAVLHALLPAWLQTPVANLVHMRQQKNLGIFAEVGRPVAVCNGVAADALPPHLSPLNAILWLTFTQHVIPMWLRMEDRVSMTCSVESRLPFMDYRLVEFAFNLPDRLKLRDGYTKYILRQAMQDSLPESVAFNRVKRRFQPPYPQWFRGAWRPMIQDLLLGPCQVQPYLHPPRFRERLQAYLAGHNSALPARTLWRVLSTEIWLQTFSASTESAQE